VAPATQTVHSEGEIFRLVRTGAAQSRADLARLTGLSPSTVALRVEELIAHGYIEENGEGESRGGRRPRVLTVKAGGSVVAGVELGEQHATVALFDRRAEVVASTVAQVSLLDGVESVVNQVWECARTLAKDNGGLTVEGIAMSLPGPVDSRTSRLLAPMRMPGWNGVDVGEVLGSVTGLPFLIDNDANAMAVGEFIERGGEQEQLVFVKAGSGIGCGIILDGAVYRGYRGVAGDISHVALHNAPPIICSCGRVGCLDVVAAPLATPSRRMPTPKPPPRCARPARARVRCSPRSSTSSTRRRSRSAVDWPRPTRSSPACDRRSSPSACPCRRMLSRSA
jgi:DNA-binding Lrp family transcriptional regulator